MLILRDELHTLWQNIDVFKHMQELNGDIARDVPGRQTMRFELDNKAYYRKLHTGVGWTEILKNLLLLRLPIIGASNEWLALNKLSDLSIPSLEPIAYGQKFNNPAKRLSFIVTRELVGTMELDQYLRQCLDNKSLLFNKKTALLSEVAAMTRAIHTNGINHRDLYLCHFLLKLDSIKKWHSNGNNKPILHLVDLHRAQIRQHVPQRWLVKDLASIYFSAMDLAISKRDIFRFLTAYFAKPLANILREDKILLRRIERRATKLYKREQRLKARGLRD